MTKFSRRLPRGGNKSIRLIINVQSVGVFRKTTRIIVCCFSLFVHMWLFSFISGLFGKFIISWENACGLYTLLYVGVYILKIILNSNLIHKFEGLFMWSITRAHGAFLFLMEHSYF